jgi:hypothetical protein
MVDGDERCVQVLAPFSALMLAANMAIKLNAGLLMNLSVYLYVCFIKYE